MAVKTIPTIKAYQDMPADLATHKKRGYVKWGETTASTKSQFTPSHGTRHDYKKDVTLTLQTKDIFNTADHGDDCFKVSINAGKEHTSNIEVKLNDQRWYPHIHSESFEYHQDSSSNNSLYLKYYARVWHNVSKNEFYTYGTNFSGENTKETAGYFYVKNALSDQEKTWQSGPVWRFKGWIFHFRSTSGAGSSHWSSVKIFNMKLHIGDPADKNAKSRLVLPAIRPSSEAYKFIY